LSFGDVLEEPDVALAGIAGLDRPSADPAPDPRAILPAHPGLARMGAPAVELGIDAAGPLPFVVGKETLARGDAHHGAGRVAEHLLEAAIAAHGPPVTGNLDPDHHIVQQRLLLREQALHLLLGAALLGDVLHDPHRPLVRIVGVDRAAVGVAPEDAAVLSPPALHAPRRRAAREGVVVGLRLLVVGAGHIEHARRLAVELSRPIAVHLLVAPVAAHDRALLDEHDADARRAED